MRRKLFIDVCFCGGQCFLWSAYPPVCKRRVSLTTCQRPFAFGVYLSSLYLKNVSLLLWTSRIICQYFKNRLSCFCVTLVFLDTLMTRIVQLEFRTDRGNLYKLTYGFSYTKFSYITRTITLFHVSYYMFNGGF